MAWQALKVVAMLTWLHRDHHVRRPPNVRTFAPQHLVYLDASASMHIPEGKTDSVCDWDAEAWQDWEKQSVDRSAPCWVHVGKKIVEKAAPLLHKSKVECAIFGDGPSFRLQYLKDEFEDHLEEVCDTWSRSCLGGTLLWQRIARDIDKMFPGEPAPGEVRETKFLIVTDGYDTESKAQYRGLMGCRQLAQDLVKKKIDAEIHIVSLGVQAVEVVDEYEKLSSWTGGSCYAVNDIEDHAGLEETLKDFSVYVFEDAEQRQTRRTARRAIFFRKYSQQNAYPVTQAHIPDEAESSKPPSRAPSPTKAAGSEVPEVPSQGGSRAESPIPAAATGASRGPSPTPESPAPDAAPADTAPQEAPAADTAKVPSRPQTAERKPDGGPQDTGEVKSLQEIAEVERVERMNQIRSELDVNRNGPNSAPPAQQVQSSVEQQQILSAEADRLRSGESTEPLEPADSGS